MPASAFKTWLDDLAPKVLPGSFTAKAISYAQNQWDYLIRYTSNGLAPIDNNVVECDPFATGRKSWLFTDTVAGAKVSAVIYSLAHTCRACGVEPYAWLRHVLTELPSRLPDADIEDLMPFNFGEHASQLAKYLLTLESSSYNATIQARRRAALRSSRPHSPSGARKIALTLFPLTTQIQDLQNLVVDLVTAELWCGPRLPTERCGKTNCSNSASSNCVRIACQRCVSTIPVSPREPGPTRFGLTR